jgi:hypothetical protein
MNAMMCIGDCSRPSSKPLGQDAETGSPNCVPGSSKSSTYPRGYACG